MSAPVPVCLTGSFDFRRSNHSATGPHFEDQSIAAPQPSGEAAKGELRRSLKELTTPWVVSRALGGAR